MTLSISSFLAGSLLVMARRKSRGIVQTVLTARESLSSSMGLRALTWQLALGNQVVTLNEPIFTADTLGLSLPLKTIQTVPTGSVPNRGMGSKARFFRSNVLIVFY